MRTWNRNGIYYVDVPGIGWRSTGLTDPKKLNDWLLRNSPEERKKNCTLNSFTENMFIPGECVWTRRQENRDHTMTKGTIDRYRRHLVNQIQPEFGGKKLRDIRQDQVEDWLDSLDLKKDTKNKILSTMRVVFNEAERHEYIDKNPIDKIKCYNVKKGEGRRPSFTPDEIQKLFPKDREKALQIHAGQKFLTFHMIMADTGLRPGEVAALKWGVWQRSLHGLLIFRSVSPDTLEIQESVKSETGVAIISERTEQELLIWESQNEDTGPDDLMFFDTGRGPIRSETSNKHFIGSCKRAGIERGKRTQYSLRHSFATQALQMVPHGTVQELMHHSNEQQLEQYDHRELQDQLIQKLQDKNIQEARKYLSRRWES